MNTEKIGKFIAQNRKEKNLTQSQLAERLNVTDKAISKWETGRGLPDASLLLDLCKILDINVNELLSGEKLTIEKYQTKAEENILLFAEENKKNKKNSKRLTIAFSTLVLFLLFIIGIFSTYDITYYFNPKFNSSNENLLIIERKTDDDSNVIFYCIFNKNGKCESCFCEFNNPPDELLNYDQRSGYIRKNKVGNTLYTEYTGLRDFSYQEIKDMFKDDIILKEW